MTQRAKWLGLGGLVVVWLALMYVYVIDVSSPQEVPLKFKSGQVARSPIRKGHADSWDVTSLHAQARELPATPKKNIFSAASLPLSPEAQERVWAMKRKRHAVASATTAPAAPPVPPPPSPEEVARQQQELAEQAAKQQAELHRKQILEQMGQYRYLGYVHQNGVQQAFLGKGREIYIIRQGDTLEGKFLVTDIEAAAVKIVEASSRLETTLKLKKEDS